MGKGDSSQPQHVTKSLFMTASACSAAGWYAVNEPTPPPTAGEMMRMLEGQDIGRRARSLFGSGVTVAGGDFAEAVAQTKRLIADPDVVFIFEAAFEFKGYAARADILARKSDGWSVIEVKSSLHDDGEASDEHIVDLAYTTQVIIRSGVRVTSAELMRLSRDWRRGHDDAALFGSHECTDAVLAKGKDIALFFESVQANVFGSVRPAPTLAYQCRECPYFETPCHGTGIDHTVFEIPRLGEKKFVKLADAGILKLLDVPDDFPLSDKQARVIAAARSGKPIVQKTALRAALKQIQWPAFYLDFETVKTAVPLWPEVAPHEQVVAQYSLHVCEAPGVVARHHEYLADPKRDCRLELAESLLRDLQEKGTIVVYSSFEKTVLNALSKRFPRLERSLQACVARLFDFERVFEHYYHPGFCGRTSIKKTLPVLVPAMSYKGLNIGDGDTAVAKFAQMARGECSDSERDSIRADLLRYCGQDTLAMVMLHDALHRLASA